MVGNVDLESDNQAGLAQEVLEAMLLGAPTTTPAIPTRTRDPDLTQGWDKWILEVLSLYVLFHERAQLILRFLLSPTSNFSDYAQSVCSCYCGELIKITALNSF